MKTSRHGGSNRCVVWKCECVLCVCACICLCAVVHVVCVTLYQGNLCMIFCILQSSSFAIVLNARLNLCMCAFVQYILQIFSHFS